MVKRYDVGFKKDAVSYLKEIQEMGGFILMGVHITDVRTLVKALGISSFSLYDWEKKYPNVERCGVGTPYETKTDHNIDSKKLSELSIELEEIITENELKGVTGQVKFGIDFWMHVARNMGITPYRINLRQLKIKIGMKLMDESGVVGTKVKEELRL